MPSTYAHYRFGCAMLATMPGDMKRTVQRFRRLFDVGIHGPDILHYQPSLFRGDPGFLGIKYHEQSGRDFFQRVCRAIRMERSEAALAYLYGVLCHYCLDSVCYPLIKMQSGIGPASASEIETEFDRFLLEADGKIPPCAQDLSNHLKLTPGECATVAKFYPPATAHGIQECLTRMSRLTKLLAVPEGAKRTMLKKTFSVFARDYRGMIMTDGPNPNCAPLDNLLMDLYRQAEIRFPKLLDQLQAHITYSAPLEKEFEPPFA